MRAAASHMTVIILHERQKIVVSLVQDLNQSFLSDATRNWEHHLTELGGELF